MSLIGEGLSNLGIFVLLTSVHGTFSSSELRECCLFLQVIVDWTGLDSDNFCFLEGITGDEEEMVEFCLFLLWTELKFKDNDDSQLSFEHVSLFIPKKEHKCVEVSCLGNTVSPL
jgi:hypothetical protein